VGKVLKGHDRSAEHRAVLAEIVEIAGERDVDAVLVAGDLYESAAPGAQAQAEVVRSLLALRATGAEVIAIAGNHDHAATFDAYRPLMGIAGIHLLGSVGPAGPAGSADPAGDCLVAFEARSTGEPVRVAALPFVSHRHAVRAADLVSRTPAQNAAAYSEAVRVLIGRLAAGFAEDAVNLMTAHLAVTGAVLGGGERPAQSVLEYHVPPAAFPPTADFVALGHMHRRQSVPGPAPLYYSGSPIAVDFGEQGVVPSVLVVETQAGTAPKVVDVPVKSARRLRTVRGGLDELAASVQNAGTGDTDLLRVIVREKPRAGLRERVAELVPNALEIRIDPEFAAPVAGRRPADAAGARRSPLELFTEYCGAAGVDVDERLAALFNRLHDEASSADSDRAGPDGTADQGAS
jgi:exonuclease SbcD